MKNEMPYLLAIDCSGRIGSAAAARGPHLLAEKIFSGRMRHSSELFPAMETLLEETGGNLESVSAFCFTRGPGSFTGLRIAVSTAKMLGFARKIPVISANTLDTIAVNAAEYIEKYSEDIEHLAVILDAKQNHFFSAVYKCQAGNWTKHIGDALISSEGLLEKLRELERPAVVGEGLLYHADLFRSAGIRILPESYWPARARGVLKIAYQKYLSSDFEDIFSLVPYYIREPEITEKSGRQR